MAKGDFRAGWEVNDRILASRDLSKRDDPSLPYHRRWVWDGRPYDRRHVLVRCYHGLGDTLQFCRFLTPLRERVDHLVIETQSELVETIKSLNGVDEIVAFDPAKPIAPSECDFEIMELCHALRLTPNPAPYIDVGYQDKRSNFRVGLCWQASPTWSSERSLAVEPLMTLLSSPGVEFVSLQRGAPSVAGLLDDCPDTILATARRIASVHLVISVDTMIAHLAGAMGVPLWLLLKSQPDWRWRAGGRGSVWYSSVRKYQQTNAGDWVPVIAQLTADLARMARGELWNSGGVHPQDEPRASDHRHSRVNDHLLLGERSRDDLARSNERLDPARARRPISRA